MDHRRLSSKHSELPSLPSSRRWKSSPYFDNKNRIKLKRKNNYSTIYASIFAQQRRCSSLQATNNPPLPASLVAVGYKEKNKEKIIIVVVTSPCKKTSSLLVNVQTHRSRVGVVCRPCDVPLKSNPELLQDFHERLMALCLLANRETTAVCGNEFGVALLVACHAQQFHFKQIRRDGACVAFPAGYV